MASVLIQNSSVTCGHQGTVETSSSAKLKVNGQPVLLKNSINQKSVTTGSCSTVPDESKGITKCETVVSVTAGEATKLKVGGQGVMLDTLSGTTDGNPIGNVPATANQNKLTAT